MPEQGKKELLSGLSFYNDFRVDEISMHFNRVLGSEQHVGKLTRAVERMTEAVTSFRITSNEVALDYPITASQY